MEASCSYFMTDDHCCEAMHYHVCCFFTLGMKYLSDSGIRTISCACLNDCKCNDYNERLSFDLDWRPFISKRILVNISSHICY